MILVAAGLLAVGLAATAGLAADLQRFADFDGDGFDDNIPDLDFDGIPDELEFHAFLSSQSSLKLGVSQMFSGSDAPTEPKQCAAERFGAREFATRGISLKRVDFDAGFGSSLGLSGGLGGGGACAGGICF
jgi:hypothetical protein